MVLLSSGENIEIEAYMLWPGLILLGVHLREVTEGIASPSWAIFSLCNDQAL
jgi:hypothetical protein